MPQASPHPDRFANDTWADRTSNGPGRGARESTGWTAGLDFSPDSTRLISSRHDSKRAYGAEFMLAGGAWKAGPEIPDSGWHRWSPHGLVYLTRGALNLRAAVPEGAPDEAVATFPFRNEDVMASSRDEPCAFRRGDSDNEKAPVLQTSGLRTVLLQCIRGGFWLSTFDLEARKWSDRQAPYPLSYEAKISLDEARQELLVFRQGALRQVSLVNGRERTLMGWGAQRHHEANLFMSGGATNTLYTVQVSPDGASALHHDLRNDRWTLYSL